MTQEAAKAYWRFTVLWLIVGVALGILAALALLLPESLSARPVLGYGRLVAAHRAAIIHGAIFAAVLASAYTLLPRLMQSQFNATRSSDILAWTGAAIVLAGVVTILGGHGSGREYADLPLVLGLVFWIWLILVAIDITIILSKARALEPNPASGLLVLAAMLPAIVYPFALPGWWGSGSFDILRTWLSWRTLYITCFTLAAIGTGLWYLNVRNGGFRIHRGVFAIAIVLIAGFGPLMGTVHVLDAPIWVGLKALGAMSGILVAIGLVLMVGMMWRGAGWDPPSFLFIAGITGIGAAALQGAMMVLPPVHTAFHFTSHTAAHAHLALGALMAIFLAGGLIAAPGLSRANLALHDRMFFGAGWFVAGMLIVILSQISSGVLQAMAFSKGLAVPDWLPSFRWLQAGTVAGGVAAFIGVFMIGRAVLCTLGKATPPAEVTESRPVIPENAVEGGEG